MLFRDDVVNLKRQRERIVWQLTVFAPLVRSFPNQAREREGQYGLRESLCLRSLLALAWRTPKRLPMCR